jgi:flavin reductase (DIM6/NTAB) family NADH-FMN oxidoreductase RutF
MTETLTADTHTPIEPRILYVGTPIALVTTMSPDGTCNIGPMSSAWTLGRTVVLGWGPPRRRSPTWTAKASA